MTDEVLAHKLDDLAEDVREIKKDVRDIKDESPVHRIRSLESWRAGVTKFAIGASVAIVGAWAAALLSLLFA